MNKSKSLKIKSLTWQEKLRLISWDDPFDNHPELVEKLKSLGVLEKCEIGEVGDFTLAGAAYRDEVYQFVRDHEKADSSASALDS